MNARAQCNSCVRAHSGKRLLPEKSGPDRDGFLLLQTGLLPTVLPPESRHRKRMKVRSSRHFIQSLSRAETAVAYSHHRFFFGRMIHAAIPAISRIGSRNFKRLINTAASTIIVRRLRVNAGHDVGRGVTGKTSQMAPKTILIRIAAAGHAESALPNVRPVTASIRQPSAAQPMRRRRSISEGSETVMSCRSALFFEFQIERQMPVVNFKHQQINTCEVMPSSTAGPLLGSGASRVPAAAQRTGLALR